MEKNDKLDIIVSAFKNYLIGIKDKFPNTLDDLRLKKYEIKKGTYSDFITFYIFPNYSINYFNSGDIRKIVDEVYKFNEFTKYFTMERDLHFYFIFSTTDL